MRGAFVHSFATLQGHFRTLTFQRVAIYFWQDEGRDCAGASGSRRRAPSLNLLVTRHNASRARDMSRVRQPPRVGLVHSQNH